MTAHVKKTALLQHEGPLVFAALTCLALAGCASAPPAPVVRVAVPVPCRVAAPQRPDMPTEALPARPDLDAFVAAVTAEIDLREGYERELVAALGACVEGGGRGGGDD